VINLDKLITSSPLTLNWLNKIKQKIEREYSFGYNEGKYSFSIKSPETKRNIAYLHPQKTQIRLFLRLPPSHDSSLKPTPSSGKWAEMYPSLFLIKSKSTIDKAIELIIDSYKYDLLAK